MAVIPSQEGNGVTPLQRWQRGFVGYWKKQAEFTSNAMPKGHVSLLQITSVQHLVDERDGRGVLIKHMPKDEVQEVTFLFDTRDEASEFSLALWIFIVELRSTLSVVGTRKGGSCEVAAKLETKDVRDGMSVYISM